MLFRPNLQKVDEALNRGYEEEITLVTFDAGPYTEPIEERAIGAFLLTVESHTPYQDPEKIHNEVHELVGRLATGGRVNCYLTYDNANLTQYVDFYNV